MWTTYLLEDSGLLVLSIKCAYINPENGHKLDRM